MPDDNDVPHMTAKETARYLRISERHLARFRHPDWDGLPGPPFYKKGRRILYHRDEIDAWIRDGGEDTIAATPHVAPIEPPPWDINGAESPGWEPDLATLNEPADPDSGDGDFDPSYLTDPSSPYSP